MTHRMKVTSVSVRSLYEQFWENRERKRKCKGKERKKGKGKGGEKMRKEEKTGEERIKEGGEEITVEESRGEEVGE